MRGGDGRRRINGKKGRLGSNGGCTLEPDLIATQMLALS